MRKPAPVHPKVLAAGAGGAGVALVLALVHAFHFSRPIAALIAAAVAFIAGWFKS